MPLALVIAFAASLGVHALALFAPDVDLSMASEPPVLLAELKASPAPPQPPPTKPAVKAVPAAKRPARSKPLASAAPRPVLTAADSVPLTPAVEPAPVPAQESGQEATPEPDSMPAGDQSTLPPLVAAASTASQLPARGTIRYRVDRGGQGFQIGFSIHEWEVLDGSYRITAVTETSGLIGLFRPLRFEVESRGRVTAAGLLPEQVVTRQQGREREEKGEFDWERMELRVGDRPAQVLRPGTQDLLSFPYQLGLMADHGSGSSLPILTGKRYGNYRVEVVGEEEISVPAGTFRCLHLRVPGVATTELWLAYERALLPVKVQHIDRKGDLYVQVATSINITQE